VIVEVLAWYNHSISSDPPARRDYEFNITRCLGDLYCYNLWYDFDYSDTILIGNPDGP